MTDLIIFNQVWKKNHDINNTCPICYAKSGFFPTVSECCHLTQIHHTF